MSSYAVNGTEPDPRLLKAFMDNDVASAQAAAQRINDYGSVVSPSELAVYRDQYASHVKGAQEKAAALGLKYTPPEIKSGVEIRKEVPGVGATGLVTKSQDILMTVDGYGKSLEHNLTAAQNRITEGLTGAKDWLMSAKIPGIGSLTDIKDQATSLYDKGKASYDSVQRTANELSDAVARPVNQIKGMSDQILNDSISRYNTLMSSPLTSVLQPDGRSLAVKLGSSIPAINKLIDTYNGISDSVTSQYARVRNLRAELAMKLSIYNLANSYGMTDLAEQIRNSDDKINSGAYHAELITQFDSALSDGDLSIITSMVTTLGAPTVLNRYPDAVSRIIKAYRFPTGTRVADYAVRRDELVTLLNSIDANWLYDRRFSGDVMRMSIFNGASDSTRKAFATSPRYNRLLVASQRFTSTIGMSLVNTVKQLYPYAAL